MNSVPPKQEGAGKTGCALHPRSRVQTAHKKTHTSIQVQRRQSGLPCAMGLRLISCSPRRPALLPPSLPRSVSFPRNLTPASGCQDHTTSPYASMHSSARSDRACTESVHRIPHPTSVTTAKRPSYGHGMGRAGSADLPDGESGIFFALRLDRFLLICPSGIALRGSHRPQGRLRAGLLLREHNLRSIDRQVASKLLCPTSAANHPSSYAGCRI
jgi:hypothetical protein